MIDKHNRNINYLRVSITDRCNLRCIYCMPREGISFIGHQDILSYEEILRIVGIAIKAGIVKVRITGGEPLTRRGVIDFLTRLKKIEDLHDISLTTNAILLEALAEEIYDAGIRRINISLDSLVEEKYRDITRGGNLRMVLRGIEKARSVGFAPVKINVVAIRGFNDEEIVDFAKLTLDNPYQVRFIEYMPIGTPALDNGRGYLSGDVVKEKINNFKPLVPVLKNPGKADGPARIYKMEGAQGEIGLISSMSHEFCDSCNRLRLTADGHLKACLLSDRELDLKGPLRDGCSDFELEELIRKAILDKPGMHSSKCHDIQRKKCIRDMSSIGG
jgi:cyclic pyranopterin phosphate synthase